MIPVLDSDSDDEAIFGEEESQSVLNTLRQWTSGVFSQADVASAFSALDVPPSSQRRLQRAATTLDGVQTVEELFGLLPQPSQTQQQLADQVRSGLEERLTQASITGSGTASSSTQAATSHAPILGANVTSDSGTVSAQGSATPHPTGLGYLGPLSSAEVQRLLGLPLSNNARRGLTSAHTGYLQFFHFAGMVRASDIVRHGRKKVNSTDAQRERWQCRSCHVYLHCMPNLPSNLGVHLFGHDSTPGCLDDRRNNPAEPIPTPERDAEGRLVRLNAAKRKRSCAKQKAPLASAPSLPAILNTEVFAPHPFFYVATSLNNRVLTATWPLPLLAGWVVAELCGLNLADLVHPEDRVPLDIIMRSRDSDPTPLRTAIDLAHHNLDAVVVPVNSASWISTCSYPGSNRSLQCRLRHSYGFYDYYMLRAHFYESAPASGTFTITWTCLKIGNDRDFPPLLEVEQVS